MNSGPIDLTEACRNSVETVQVLTKNFRHRHLGLEDEINSAKYFAKQLNDIGVPTDTHVVDATGWKIVSEPSLRIKSPVEKEIEFGPMIYSGSTGEQGIEGSLVYEGVENLLGSFPCSKYSIQDDSGRRLGFVFGRSEGLAVMQPHLGTAPLEPSAIVGSSDNSDLLGIRKSAKVSYRCESRFEPRIEALRVQGALRGKIKPEQIVVINAHLDCQGAEGAPEGVDSLGAVDDGAGCGVLLEFAKHYSKIGAERTVIFSLTCGEEWGKIGSKALAQHLDDTRLTPKLAAFINIDAICFRGVRELVVNASGSEIEHSYDMREICERALRKTGAEKGKFDIKEWYPPRGFDQQHFYERHVPVATIFTHNDQYYHRNADRFPDSLDEELLQRAIEHYSYVLEATCN